jgi:CheY-like chemotaxis protein
MKTRILVIEDNPDNLELMTYLLKQHQYTTLSAVDGEEGLAAIYRERPNLIICDIQLPKFNGYEIAKKIKADESIKKIPLIAVTANSMVGDRNKILAAGFDGYLSKPIDPEIFIEQIDEFLIGSL